ncbi:MAG: ATP-binding cassette domain-containing protein [Coriobacteriia bacterium]|nr:ATP-binding cassette domain-containing protein [Coriobacteriia bacterium]
MFLTFSGVSFAYRNAVTPILDDLSFSLPNGWTGVIGANGQGKTTLMRLAAGELTPVSGAIQLPGHALYCAQATEKPPALLSDFSQDWGADASRLRSILQIDDDWPWRFDSLSHGERKRLQLAVALWHRPYVLAIDEPTNHLDIEARSWVTQALEDYEGIGLLVSHDRSLLDALVGQCVVLEHGGAALRSGNYTEVHERIDQERLAAHRYRRNAKQELSRLTQEATRRRTEADRDQSKRSRRRIDPKDHDAKAKIGFAILTGKDGHAGRLSSQMKGRLARAQERLAETRVDRETRADIWIDGEHSARAILAELGPARLPLGGTRVLEVPYLTIGPKDRIAVVGPNGVGKTTLLNSLISCLRLECDRVLLVPQELSQVQAADEIRELKLLDSASRGLALSIVARLGSAPDRLLDGETPSPGELRKLMIARGVRSGPHLLVLDEPTNHMDLLATEALEEALAAYSGALLLVSHDPRFIERLTDVTWEIRRSTDGDSVLHIR